MNVQHKFQCRWSDAVSAMHWYEHKAEVMWTDWEAKDFYSLSHTYTPTKHSKNCTCLKHIWNNAARTHSRYIITFTDQALKTKYSCFTTVMVNILSATIFSNGTWSRNKMLYDRIMCPAFSCRTASNSVQCLKSLLYIASKFDRINSPLGNSSYCILMSKLMAFETDTRYLSDKLWANG